MQQIEMNFVIFEKDVVQKGFNEFKNLVKSNLETYEDKAIITFYTDDMYITKEFSNYVIALSAVGA